MLRCRSDLKVLHVGQGTQGSRARPDCAAEAAARAPCRWWPACPGSGARRTRSTPGPRHTAVGSQPHRLCSKPGSAGTTPNCTQAACWRCASQRLLQQRSGAHPARHDVQHQRADIDRQDVGHVGVRPAQRPALSPPAHRKQRRSTWPTGWPASNLCGYADGRRRRRRRATCWGRWSAGSATSPSPPPRPGSAGTPGS